MCKCVTLFVSKASEHGLSYELAGEVMGSMIMIKQGLHKDSEAESMDKLQMWKLAN